MPGPNDPYSYYSPSVGPGLGYFTPGAPLPTPTLPTLTASSFGESQSGAGRYYSPLALWARYPDQTTGAPAEQDPRYAQLGGYNYYRPSVGVGVGAAGVNYPNPQATLPQGTPVSGRVRVGRELTPGAGAVPGTGVRQPRTWRDIGREQVDSKLGAGWFDRFKAAHGVDALEFYSDPRNMFPYQRDALADYGPDSREFANATIRAVIHEGTLHAQEAAEWQQKHGNTPISDEQWVRWYYANRYGTDDNGLMQDGLPPTI